MAIPLSEIKKWKRQKYDSICRKLARRKNEVKDGYTHRERGQEYEVGRRDARYIEELRRTKSSSSTQPNRSQRSGWQYRLGLLMNIFLLIGILLLVLSILGSLANLNQGYFRTVGGSMLVAAALSFWLQPMVAQANKYGGFWKALWAAVWRNPLNNPGMLATVGAAILYAADWWPNYGSKLLPTIVDLIRIVISLVAQLFG